MPDTLLIHYRPTQPEAATWSLANDAGELTSRITTGTLEDAAEIAKQHRVVVLLDNTSVHINSVTLPVRNQQKLLRAIPFALEEDIADDVEAMHFVASKIINDQPTAVASINRNHLDVILDSFSNAGITVDSIIPDSICLAANPNQWCALFHNNEVTLQTGALNGHIYDLELFDTVLLTELKNQDKPEKILLFHNSNDSLPDTSSFTDEDIEIVNVQYNTHPLVIYANHYKLASELDLLQHEYKPQRTGVFDWRQWRLAASLGIIWLALSLGITGYQLYQTNQKNSALNSEITNIYKSAFPESKRIINPRLQMEQKLKELKVGGTGAGDNMISLIANSSHALATEPDITVQTLNFRNGRLDITINSKNLKAIQDLNNRLNKAPEIKSEIVSSSSEQNQVKANLRVQRNAS